MLAVGPPRSDTVPVKPGTLSRISSISWRMDSWERLWMIRPSCSVMEQKVQPPKQPRMMFTEKRIISYAVICLKIKDVNDIAIVQGFTFYMFVGPAPALRKEMKYKHMTADTSNFKTIGSLHGALPIFLDLVEDGLMGAALDDTALVLDDGAEGTATEADTHDVHREADHLEGRNLLVPVGRMRHPGVGQPEHVVHLLGGQGYWRRVEPDIPFTMALHQRPGVAGVGFQMQYPVGMGIEHRIVAHLLVGRQADHGAITLDARMGQQFDHLHLVLGLRLRPPGLLHRAGGGILGVDVGVDDLVYPARAIDPGGVQLEPALGRVPADEGGAADVGQLAHRLAGRQTLGDLDHGALGVAVQQQIGLGVDQQRGAHLVLPVVVV